MFNKDIPDQPPGRMVESKCGREGVGYLFGWK